MAENDNISPSCGTCEHWLMDDIENINDGLCRRYPPQGFMVGAKDGPRVLSQFVTTGRQNKCGEYKRKSALIN